MILEVCIDSVESAIAAERGGARRVELCADLDHGGTTPSARMIRAVREKVSINVHVMIRPRAGGFCYSDSEFETMKNDILETRKLGVDGVVFGILTNEGNVDVVRTRMLLEMARPLSVTFHRAFDENPDLFASLAELTHLGVDRVLTSGGQPDVQAGLQTLAKLVQSAGSSIKVLAGGGITMENVQEVVRRTGVNEVHALSSVSSPLTVHTLHPKFFHSPQRVVEESKVRRMVELLENLPAPG